MESLIEVGAKSAVGWFSLSLSQANSLRSCQRCKPSPGQKHFPTNSIREPGSFAVPNEKKRCSRCCCPHPHSWIFLPYVLSHYSHSVTTKYTEISCFLSFGIWDHCFYFHYFEVLGWWYTKAKRENHSADVGLCCNPGSGQLVSLALSAVL